MSTTITAERPDTADARALIDELEDHLASLYPAASRHGFSVDQLLRQGVAFFVLRHDGAAAGCGGVHIVGAEYGELKRMYVRPALRGLGLGRLMLEHLEAYARGQGVALLRLETGSHQHAAISLYERSGFRQIPPFAKYIDDPLSRCYEKRIG